MLNLVFFPLQTSTIKKNSKSTLVQNYHNGLDQNYPPSCVNIRRRIIFKLISYQILINNSLKLIFSAVMTAFGNVNVSFYYLRPQSHLWSMYVFYFLFNLKIYIIIFRFIIPVIYLNFR